MNLPPTIRGVIFDFDGTLVDSESNYKAADRLFLQARGLTITPEEQEGFTGIGVQGFLAEMRKRGLTGDADQLIAEKDAAYLAYAAGRTRAFPRIIEFARYLHVQGIPMAIATSSRRNVLDRILAETGIEIPFAATVAAEDVRSHKPHPDVFLAAAERMGVDPATCLVVEDSSFGVEGALAAGMRVVAVPASRQSLQAETSESPFDRSELLFDSPDEFDIGSVIERFDLTSEPEAFDEDTVKRFREAVHDFARTGRRMMPWRETTDPYAILVSELMLQQTQTGRVGAFYSAFITRFPTFESLASSPFSEVLKQWQGLGYNRRARFLYDCASIVVSRHAGRLPSEVDQLKALPGIGPYTAAAVAAFAFGTPVSMIETNIRRVFIHFFFRGRGRVRDAEIMPLVEATLDRDDPRGWYYALMDYGASLVGLVPNPNRQSAHYNRQAPFAGSVREVRGRILHEVTRHGRLTIRDLERLVGPTDSRFIPALDGLENERLIVREADCIRPAE